MASWLSNRISNSGADCIGSAAAHGSAQKRPLRALALLPFLLAVATLTACKKAPTEPPRPTVEVTVVTVAQKETPVDFEFTAQTQSSREVEIRARVDGFLERRLYDEGSLVKEGQVLFVMDRKPFEAAL
ncbi:biotin/lipoyl-binding protein, partial [Paraburkholderia sp. Tr-20389]|uniref:biotin/lipoyl-binding protein n=1 Tax=Paraburkholderia sp. Tr-20389 TaxID=2703903 RepID=UPI001980DA8C